MTLTRGHWGDAPWGRWLLQRFGSISGQPQLLADRAYEGDEMRALAAELGWELVTPRKRIELTAADCYAEREAALAMLERSAREQAMFNTGAKLSVALLGVVLRKEYRFEV